MEVEMSRKEATSLKELLKIRDNNREKIDSVNQHLGSALGFKYSNGQQTNHPAIIIFVPDKIAGNIIPSSQLIPNEFEITEENGDILYCKTDVVRGGKASEETDPPPITIENRKVVNELQKGRIGLIGGVQLGAFDNNGGGYVGTASCAVIDADGKKGLLTNQHVAGAIGRRIYHPRPGQYSIGRTKLAMEYVYDEIHFDNIINEENALVRADCAFIGLDEHVQESLKPGLHKLGELGEVLPIDLDSMDVIGTEVVSIGRTRGIQKGIIAAFAYEWSDEEKWSVYTDLLIISDEPGRAFSDHGDSGKLIVTANGNNPIALLWGGWQERLRKGYEQENWTYAIELSKVLKYLKLEIMR